MVSIELALDELRATFGFGVAGNFAGHLEQAGEAGDFVDVVAESADAPRGIFPFYVPGADTFLGTFPLSNDRIAKPALSIPPNLQLEPEVGLLCAVEYDDAGAVRALAPRALGAFNDCSIRREGAAKISEKKNWGADSKGVAPTFLAVDDLDPSGPVASLRLASFLRRGEALHAYGVDSPLPGYSYFGARLLEWMAGRLRDQEGADGTPLQDVGALLRDAGNPGRVLVGIGATRYTPYGERTYLDAGDEVIVVVYDGDLRTPGELESMVAAGGSDGLGGASVLRQTVYDARPPER